jgi:hypothetical protein
VLLVLVQVHEEVREVHADDELHDDVERIVRGATEVEGLRHVGARDVRGEARLVQEHLHELRVAREVREHALDGHEFLEAALAAHARRVDLRHAAEPDAEEGLVPAELQLRDATCGARRGCALVHEGFRRVTASWASSIPSFDAPGREWI